MPNYQWSVLLWSASGGGVTAALLGDYENNAAHAETGQDALRQLKDLLDWRVHHESWNLEPDLVEPELIEVQVDVRPQYEERRRLIPCPDTVRLRVPCVVGKSENGAPVCEVPHLALRFNFQERAVLKDLVRHYVKEGLHGMTPLALASRLPPRDLRLATLSVREDTGRSKRMPVLEREGFDVLLAAADPLLQDRARGSAAYGREALAAALERKLQHERVSILLVGESGVGKTTLLIQAARRLARKSGADNDDDRSLAPYRWWRGSGARMIAGMRYVGEWEERCEEFIAQLARIEGVFCAENLLELTRIGGRGPGDSVAAFLLPYLMCGELRMVAEATPAEIEACRRLLPGLLDAFQILNVEPFDESTARAVLQRIAAASGLDIAPDVPPLVHRLFRRFQPYAVFPGPAATFLRRMCDDHGRQPRAKANKKPLTADHVIERFIGQTGLPEVFLRDEQPLAFETIRESFARQIIGQPAAVEAAANLVASIKAGLTDPCRPSGVLLFCGPTGVGKTALAKALAEFCFGSGAEKQRLVRLDMSEYSQPGSGWRFLHSPDGQPAAWLERMRRQPFAVVLFDEIEKAASEIFDVLLSLLDEGRLTDRYGRVVSFRSAIVLLTSNIGSTAGAPLGFDDAAEPAYEGEVMKFFRPEFFNRLDGVIAFDMLTPAGVREIVAKELGDLATREGLADAGLRLAWSERVVEAVAKEGYDRRFGARPLQRTLERLIVTPLARWRVAHPEIRDSEVYLDMGSAGEATIRLAT